MFVWEVEHYPYDGSMNLRKTFIVAEDLEDAMRQLGKLLRSKRVSQYPDEYPYAIRYVGKKA